MAKSDTKGDIMIYRQYDLTSNKEIAVIYRCSNCKQWHSFIHTLSAKSAYNTKGALTNQMIKERAARAETNLRDKQWELNNKVREEAERKCYHTARFSYVCPDCGHQEPWARMAFPIAFLVAKIGGYIALFATMIWSLQMMEMPDFWVGFKMTAGVYAPWYLPLVLSYVYIFISRFFLDKKVRELPKYALPVICWSQHEFDVAVKNLPNSEIEKEQN